MPSYTILSMEDMELPDWSAVPAVSLKDCGWTPETPVRAKAQLCCDRTDLHVRLEAEEPAIRATYSGTLDPVHLDSCLEFFFAPRGDDQRYLNFEWNPLVALDLGFGAGRADRVRQIVQDPKGLFRPAPFSTDTGWGISFRIPLRFLRLYFPDYAFSGEAAGNFFKCGDETVQPHFLAWAKPTSREPDFHRRNDFGLLLFEEEEPED